MGLLTVCQQGFLYKKWNQEKACVYQQKMLWILNKIIFIMRLFQSLFNCFVNTKKRSWIKILSY
ncbi:MAG: hypothetical protein A2275_18695 [Bacteroidetes bacterium RIFOXYA12_FULL_35_11]|nr:MAG: hypothetical protein A2X01_18255 [Bacteroidetes bacterium GWF2_35_48]OFY72902.1 MAG: hypothetical protein A2275_18695 [Bacteroidetes bacterium RIFOXYA12_FULL_35_11]OFY95758.1 MAG: hypothetical protein A2491_08005 [Bacteroidetes bacterium RIFOXYC12_FULL_35_7]HBX52134.1 hypothetical protein [Bacteroidales bacterium]